MNDDSGTSELVYGSPFFRIGAKLESLGMGQSQGDSQGSGAPGTSTAADAGDARQGHRYSHEGNEVIALSSGACPFVARVLALWLGEPYRVDAKYLTAMPMAYFHGEVPK